MNSESPPRKGNASGLDQCIESLRFYQATELVRAGKYTEAEALLSPQGQVPETAREWDLLARINAHQERFANAVRCWEAALKKDPGNPGYKTCIQQISDIQAGKDLLVVGSSTGIRIGVGVCVVLMIVGLMYWTHRPALTPVKVTLIEEKPEQPTPTPQGTSAGLPAAPVTDAAIEQISQKQTDLAQAFAQQMAIIETNQTVLLVGQKAAYDQAAASGESIAELKKQLAETQHEVESIRSNLTTTVNQAANKASPEVAADQFPSPSCLNLDTSEAMVKAQNNTWLITFNTGLFDRDEHFRIGAKARLESVAKALVQTQAKYKLQIIGLAEDELPTWPWSKAKTYEELGLLRAKTVLLYLRSLEIFPSAKLSAISGGASQRPFTTPNLNNRSVVLEIVPE